MSGSFLSEANFISDNNLSDENIGVGQYTFGEIIESKTFSIPSSQWIKQDGEVMVTFSKMLFKFLHIKTQNNNLVTDVIAQFEHSNNTQNNRGEHHCTINLFIIDNNKQSLAIPYANINIIRDQCGNVGTTMLPQVRIGTDFFDLAEGFGWSGSASWIYEGGC